MPDINPTVRRFPRSMREAFPHERFPAVEHYRRPGAGFETVFGACVIGAAVLLFVVTLVRWAAE